MQDHVHIMQKGNDRDGSQSHGTTRDSVPNWLMDAIRKRGLVEGALLVEASGTPIQVPPELIQRAHAHSEDT